MTSGRASSPPSPARPTCCARTPTCSTGSPATPGTALGEGPLDAVALAALPDAVRARVWRLVALEAGVPAGALFAVHVDALDALVGPRWRGQGPVDLPGGLQARRAGGQVLIGTTRPVQ